MSIAGRVAALVVVLIFVYSGSGTLARGSLRTEASPVASPAGEGATPTQGMVAFTVARITLERVS